jgi:hypothetical protein
MTSYPIRLPEASLLALAKLLDTSAPVHDCEYSKALSNTEYDDLVVARNKIRKAAQSIVHADTASRRTPSPVVLDARDHDRTCPDCKTGKHNNCDGTAWDNLTDAPTDCRCPEHPVDQNLHELHTEFSFGCLPCAQRQLGIDA